MTCTETEPNKNVDLTCGLLVLRTVIDVTQIYSFHKCNMIVLMFLGRIRLARLLQLFCSTYFVVFVRVMVQVIVVITVFTLVMFFSDSLY